MTDPHSAIAHAAYIDLLRLLQEDAASDLRGTPTLLRRNGRGYWYDSFRLGNSVRKTYLGEDTPGLRARLERHTALTEDRDARRHQRTRLIRILRAEGFLGVDAGSGSLLAALARSGVFRLGGTIVGTHAFRLYEGVLGLRYSFDQMAQTGDIDIASFERLSLALEDSAAPPLENVFRDLAFAPVPGLNKGQTWRWKQSRSQLLVEFLTPSFDAAEDIRPLPALGVAAQSLHHLNYLISEPIAAAAIYRSGVLVQVPRPERFAIHKLIISERRRSDLRAHKDRAQAAFLIKALARDRPDELAQACEDARAQGPKWRARLDAALARMPKTRALLDAL